jgi:uncharacterized membrane protein YdfJ with MMPL/SSD domain
VALDSESAAIASFLNTQPGASNEHVVFVLVPLQGPALIPSNQQRVSRVSNIAAHAGGYAAAYSYLGPQLAMSSGPEQITRLSPAGRKLISKDAEWTAVILLPEPQLSSSARLHNVDDLRSRLRPFGVLLGGRDVSIEALSEEVRNDLRTGELIGFPALLLVLLLVFRRGYLTVLPLAGAALTLSVSLLCVRIMHALGIYFSLLAMGPLAALSLGLSVDYSLLLINRYREVCKSGERSRPALEHTLQSVGPPILTSAAAIFLTMTPLTLVPIAVLASIGRVAALCAFIAAAVTLLVIPAFLLIYGDRITRTTQAEALVGSPHIKNSRFWRTVPGIAIRHPIPALALSAICLTLLAAPLLSMKAGGVSSDSVSSDTKVRAATHLLQHRFKSSFTRETFRVLAPLPTRTQPYLRRLTAEVKGVPGVAGITSSKLATTRLLQLGVAGESEIGSPASQKIVNRLRQLNPRLGLFVGGPAAVIVDREETLAFWFPWIVLGGSMILFCLVFLLTGSFVLPIKIILLTAITLLATLGTLVLIFQFPGGEATPLDTGQLVLLCAIIMALVTDYGIFVTSRIASGHTEGLPDDEAIAEGLAGTGPVVSAAALVFCIAVGAFALSDISLIRQFCIGMAVAVIIDTSIVRALLTPSLMVLLGRFNWWAPTWAVRFREWANTKT